MLLTAHKLLLRCSLTAAGRSGPARWNRRSRPRLLFSSGLWPPQLRGDVGSVEQLLQAFGHVPGDVIGRSWTCGGHVFGVRVIERLMSPSGTFRAHLRGCIPAEACGCKGPSKSTIHHMDRPPPGLPATFRSSAGPEPRQRNL